MARSTRRLAAALRGDYGDYFYDKERPHGQSGRRTQRKVARLVTKRARALSKREAASTIRDEL